jgi:hypothetical protein
MRTVRRVSLWALVGCSLSVSSALAVSVPYSENFDSSNQNWKNSVSNLSQDATWVSGGGPGGAGDAFIESTITTPASGTPSSAQVVFRARNTVNSSNNEFFGDWITENVTRIDLWVRHDAPTALDLGLRIPTSMGFPAMLGRFPDPIQPNVWTLLSMDINDTNPELLDETGPTHNNFNPVFSNVTYLQLFANLSGLPNSTTVHFDLDRVTIVPEPSTWLMAGLGLPALGLAIRARRRRRTA